MRRYRIPRLDLKEEHLEGLVQRSLDGDGESWAKLWLALTPWLDKLAACWWLTGRLARCVDGRLDVVVHFMGALREDGSRLLAELGERLALRDGSARRWLRSVAINAARMYVRAHAEYLRPAAGERGQWVSHLPLLDVHEDERPDPLEGVEARRLLARARQELDAAQYDALCLWLRRDGFDEIADALGLGGGADEAARLVRSALKRLRTRLALVEPMPKPTARPAEKNRPVPVTDRRKMAS